MLQFMFNHMEYIVVGVGAIGVAVYIKFRNVERRDNDLTPLVVKLKKQNDAVNNRTKSVI